MSTQPSTIPSLTPPSKDGGETEPNRLSDEPQSTIPKMPPHWQKAAKLSVGAHKTSALSHAQDLFPLIFTLAFGHHTPEELWDITFDKTEWRAYIDRLSNRLSSILIVAGLLLASFAALTTTEPPVKSALNYTYASSYYCILAALGFTLAGITIGSGVVFVVLADFRESYFRDVLMGNMGMMLITIIMLSYPVLMIVYAFVFGLIGLLLATLPGKIHGVIGVAVVILLLPLLLVVVFLLAQLGTWMSLRRLPAGSGSSLIEGQGVASRGSHFGTARGVAHADGLPGGV